MPPAKKKRAPRKKAAVSKATNLLVFTGSDEGRVKQAAHDAFRAKSEGLDEFAAETVDGTAENSEDAGRVIGRTLEALQTLPFFGGEKVVWLKGANFMGDSVMGNSKATQSGLEALIKVLEQGLPPEVTFILHTQSIDKRRTFYRRLQEVARIETFDKPDTSRDGWERDIMQFVGAEASKRGLRFQRDALELFAMLLGVETQQANQELDKLDLYLGDRREVTAEDVRQVVSLSRGGVIFEIGNALAKRQLSRTVDLIDHLLQRDESAVGILLGAIVPQVRRLLQAKDLVHRFNIRIGSYQSFNSTLARLPPHEIAHLPVKKDGTPNGYPIFLAATASSQFRVEELRAGLEACLEANLRLVTTSLEPKVVLHQLVVQLLTGQHRPSRSR